MVMNNYERKANATAPLLKKYLKNQDEEDQIDSLNLTNLNNNLFFISDKEKE